MNNIVKKINSIKNLYHAKGCTFKQINEAQRELGIYFSEEYICYLQEFGAISFYGTEWTGLNVDKYIDVVEITKQERDINDLFPKDCFVVENQGIEGIVIVSNENGKIYEVYNDKIVKICESLSQYLDMCLLRANL